MKSALITGITGQDGIHLGNLLISKGYNVFGLIRGQNNPKKDKTLELIPGVNLIEGDLMDSGSLYRALEISKPDEVYNLGAISFVKYSFEQPELTANITGLGVLKLLESIRLFDKENKIRFYQASTSEMYGGLDYNRPKDGYTEESIFHPRSPYGVSKLFAHWLTKNYRENYNMHASCGILFNHEGEHRGHEFVTRKISSSVARIKLGLQESIELGDLWPKRDWGYAGDYVEGMWLMLQQEKPDDYVLATGETHSIEEFLEVAFREVGIDNWRPYVKQNPKFTRPSEVNILLGNPSKAENVLKWKRKVNFEDLVKIMVGNDLDIESKNIK
jgi:GDPmannose 4,6-dehydratase